MYRALLAVVAVSVLNATGTSGGEPDDGKALQGQWKVIKIEGQAGGPPLKTALHFDKDGFKVVADGKDITVGAFRLDPGKKPKHIDLRLEKSPNPQQTGKVLLGIYEVRGD